MARLDEYRRRRDFAATPEPSGSSGSASRVAADRFVVQEHHARTLHWDLRLAHDGTLASWAVPKGIPMDPGVNRLAKRTEDHPEEYLTFEGIIPPGHYGAGRMTIWDSGTYECEKWQHDEILLTLHGSRVNGRYVLVRTRDHDWLLRRRDPAEDPQRTAPPTGGPMLATLGTELPRGPGWCYELKWDGMRCLCRIEGGRPHLLSRNHRDVTAQYPELRALATHLGSTDVLLDGEIVAFDPQGRPDFHRLQRRMHADGEHRIRRLMKEVPVVYIIFDLLWVNGRDLTDLPFRERRAALEHLDLDTDEPDEPRWHRSPVYDDPTPLLEVAERFDLEGLMAKRLDARDVMGRRSPAWRKYRRVRRQEFVVGGWVPGQGTRADTIGGLLVGAHDERGDIRYAGRVGSGFTDDDLALLTSLMRRQERATSPFLERGLPRSAHWVEPTLVVEVRFTDWTPAGRLRHPTYLGVRHDVDPLGV